MLALAALTAINVALADRKDRKTLLIASDWDFAPYEFIDNDGKSSGFNIEVLDNILNELKIPHTFVMGSRKKADDLFRTGKADLIIDYSNRFTNENHYRSLSVLEYSNIVIAYNKKTKPITKLSELENHVIIMNGSNDSITRSPMEQMLKGAAKVEYHSAREALTGIESGEMNYFIWGKELLKWKIKEFNLNNIVVGSLDIPASEIHIVGYDQELIEDIDNQFARMQQRGQIDQMRNKWFHPDQVVKRVSSMVKYTMLGVLLFSIMVYGIYRLAKNRMKKAVRKNQMMEAMMRQALSMGEFAVFINDLRHNHVTNQHGNVLPSEGITGQEMMAYVHPDDRQSMMERPNVMKKIPGQPHPFKMRWNSGTKEKPKWTHTVGYSFAEMKHHRPTNIVIVSRDVTEQVRKQQKDRELTERYMKMFDSTLLAMSFYDKEGRLINLNENMKKLCGMTEQSLKYFWTARFFDVEMMKQDFNPDSPDDFHVCQRMSYPEIGIDKYVEMRVHPITNDKQKLQYYIVTARDVSDERAMYLELDRQSKALSEASKTNSRYEKELRTMLENCNMYVWHANPQTGQISFSRSLHKEEFTETFDDYLDGIAQEFQKEARKSMQNITSIKEPFNFVRHFNYTPVSSTPTWFAISGMPIFDDNGNMKMLFGLLRDVTMLMEAQEQLKEETARAENSAMLKSTFLANMTHEIRTPLNAIVGFSDLLHSVDSPEDKKEFIRIIRNNSDMLLRLINDIFEASTMDVKPLAIVPKDVDFAKEFNVVCQSLAQRVEEPGVKFIADRPYDSLFTKLDMGRMQQVITNFVTNAVKYTHKGHIRVGYCIMKEDKVPSAPKAEEITNNPVEQKRTPREGLYIYCEDTGAGIPKDKQAKVFDRFVKLNDFVQGTGLGLAICKSIATRCSGKIGIISEGEGKGSTFWIWVPCTPITKGK